MFHEIGRLMIFFGAFLVLIGIILLFADKIPLIGKLPGDFTIRRKNFTFYFPLATCILLSLLLTLLWRFFSRK